MATLSFVIPTLNFGAFLPQTLDSILSEAPLGVEIIVFDGGSSDNTLEVLSFYEANFPSIKVVIATKKGDIDTDLNQAVSLAAGDYIWTLSSDDVLIAGWSASVAALLKKHQPDLLLVPAIHCNIQLVPRRYYPILSGNSEGPLISVVNNDADFLRYVKRVRTSEGLFSFCSACIVRRERLFQSVQLESANGTCWRYATRLISVLTTYPSTVIVLNDPWILKRGDNDSFAKSGAISRLRIATVNWDSAISSLNLTPIVKGAALLLVKSDISVLTLLNMSQFVRSREERLSYKSCVDSRFDGDDNTSIFVGAVLKRFPAFYVIRKFLILCRSILRLVQQRYWSAALSRKSNK